MASRLGSKKEADGKVLSRYHQLKPIFLKTLLHQCTMFTPSTETQKYLEEIEQELYKSIQNRKKLQGWLFFSTAQFTSASLSLYLFQLSANLIATYTLSSFIALLPGLLDSTGNISINSKKEWVVATPTTSLIKLVGGATTAVTANYQLWSRVKITQDGIHATYKIIRKNSPYIEIFNAGFSIVLVISIISGLMLWRSKNE